MTIRRPSRHPIGGHMSEVVGGLVRRFQLQRLEEHHDRTLVLGAFALLNGFISIALMAGAAFATGQPFVFPSLGPTAFLLFYTPRLATASPRNTIAGHLIGVVAGYLALVVFGLTAAGPALAEGITVPRVLAAALSLGLTAGFMVWLHVPHPPAGATTLIISLGILTRPEQLTVLMLAVVLLVGQGLVINRLAGIDYPLWAPRRAPEA
jgi:CBS-domain-containing membrane protein